MSDNKIPVDTTVDHDIPLIEFKMLMARTSTLTRYVGRDYIKKLQSLNDEYEDNHQKIINHRELSEKADIITT
jgi:hypothetical protein